MGSRDGMWLTGHMTRRQLLQYTGALGGAALTGSILAACGGGEAPDGPSSGTDQSGGGTSTTSGSSDDNGATPSGETGEGSAGPGEGTFGGTFTAATRTPPPTLDVMTSTTSAAREATWFTVESLITYSEDYELIPLLAESWELSDDGLGVTFHLRQGVKFHNGKEMTSEDVIASLDRFFEVTSRVTQFVMMDSYEATDDSTVVFHLNTPSLAFLDALALPYNYIAIFPKEIIEGRAAGSLEVEDMIGTGPYRLVEWKPDQYVRYERFEDYQPLDEPRSGLGGGKVPYFDEIKLVSVPEPGARVAGLETGEYDFAAAPATTDYPRLQENPEIAPHILEDLRWVVILFNHRNTWSNNLTFRQAIQAAADMEAIALAITNGRKEFFRLQPSLWFPGSPWFNEAGAELYNQNDVEKAKQLLQESGYNGEEIVLVTNRNYDYMYKGILALDEQLKTKLGMNSKVEVLDWPAQQAKWEEESTWHISTTGYLSQAIFAPDAYAGFYGGGGASAGAGYNNPDMTAAFERAATTMDLEERKAAFQEVQRIFHADVAGLKLCDNAGLDAVRSNIHGFAPWYNTTRFWSCWREE